MSKGDRNKDKALDHEELEKLIHANYLGLTGHGKEKGESVRVTWEDLIRSIEGADIHETEEEFENVELDPHKEETLLRAHASFHNADADKDNTVDFKEYNA